MSRARAYAAACDADVLILYLNVTEMHVLAKSIFPHKPLTYMAHGIASSTMLLSFIDFALVDV